MRYYKNTILNLVLPAKVLNWNNQISGKQFTADSVQHMQAKFNKYQLSLTRVTNRAADRAWRSVR